MDSSQYVLRIAIEICGFNILGRFFTERSETSPVSDRGCKFCLCMEIAPDAILALRVVNRGRKRGQEAAVGRTLAG
jgi:hypothetical protein